MSALLLPPGAAPARLARVPHEQRIILSTGQRLVWNAEQTEALTRSYRAGMGISPSCGVWLCHRDHLALFAAMDPTAHGELLHVSVSCESRYPRWNELSAVKAAFFGPDIDAMMVMPQEADYVNVMRNCFHLWQTPQVWGIR